MPLADSSRIFLSPQYIIVLISRFVSYNINFAAIFVTLNKLELFINQLLWKLIQLLIAF